MQVEVKTQLKIQRDGTPLVILSVILLPRGSGNRNRARRLADAFRNHPRMKPHIREVICGASRVTVHMRSSLSLLREINALAGAARAGDVPGQLALFGK